MPRSLSGHPVQQSTVGSCTPPIQKEARKGSQIGQNRRTNVSGAPGDSPPQNKTFRRTARPSGDESGSPETTAVCRRRGKLTLRREAAVRKEASRPEDRARSHAQRVSGAVNRVHMAENEFRAPRKELLAPRKGARAPRPRHRPPRSDSHSPSGPAIPGRCRRANGDAGAGPRSKQRSRPTRDPRRRSHIPGRWCDSLRAGRNCRRGIGRPGGGDRRGSPVAE